MDDRPDLGARVLCVDADPETRRVLRLGIEAMGHVPLIVDSLDAARAEINAGVDLAVVGLETEDDPAIRSLELLRDGEPSTPLILLSPHERPVLGIDGPTGLVTHLTKPVRAEALRIAVQAALEVARLREAERSHRDELRELRGTRTIIGRSPGLQRALDMVRLVASTGSTVLVEGESGTGKELVARALHEWSPRVQHPFVAINCGALPEGLIESSLFGHERGAFTGAHERAIGAFERAHHGTLFLDEISEMRHDLQPRLLRVIQEREFERVGGRAPIQVDVRVVATTNLDLRKAVDARTFRQDLFFRLKVVSIHLPPLRDRRADIPLLAHHFAQRFTSELGRPTPRIPPSFMERLLRHSWPGNIRELANVMERAVVLSSTESLDPAVLEIEESPAAPRSPLRLSTARPGEGASAGCNLRELQADAIQRALEASGGNRVRAARMLGISERTLRNKLRPSSRPAA